MKEERTIEQVLLRYLQEEVPAFFAVVDRAGRVLQSNQLMRELAGFAFALPRETKQERTCKSWV